MEEHSTSYFWNWLMPVFRRFRQMHFAKESARIAVLSARWSWLSAAKNRDIEKCYPRKRCWRNPRKGGFRDYSSKGLKGFASSFPTGGWPQDSFPRKREKAFATQLKEIWLAASAVWFILLFIYSSGWVCHKNELPFIVKHQRYSSFRRDSLRITGLRKPENSDSCARRLRAES